jgi:hypothetical protein
MISKATTDRSNGNSVSELLTEQQTSERFNISVNTLRYWRQVGCGPSYIKLGKLVRYDVNALKIYLQRNLRVSKARAISEEFDVAH